MDAISAKCGHLKRRLKRNERLTGELLEFALDVAWDEEIAPIKIFLELLTELRDKTNTDQLRITLPEHHALHDARANRYAFRELPPQSEEPD